MPTLAFRIVILHVAVDVWCDLCGAPCATTVTYVEDVGEQAPAYLYRLTYCESCEER